MKIVIGFGELPIVMRIGAAAEIGDAQVVFDGAGHPAVGAVVVQGCKIDEFQRLAGVGTFGPDTVFQVDDRAAVGLKHRVGHDRLAQVPTAGAVRERKLGHSPAPIAVDIAGSIRRAVSASAPCLDVDPVAGRVPFEYVCVSNRQ